MIAVLENSANFFLRKRTRPGIVLRMNEIYRQARRSHFSSCTILRDFSWAMSSCRGADILHSRKFQRLSRSESTWHVSAGSSSSDGGSNRPPPSPMVDSSSPVSQPPAAISFYSHRKLIHGPDTGYPHRHNVKVLPYSNHDMCMRVVSYDSDSSSNSTYNLPTFMCVITNKCRSSSSFNVFFNSVREITSYDVLCLYEKKIFCLHTHM